MKNKKRIRIILVTGLCVFTVLTIIFRKLSHRGLADLWGWLSLLSMVTVWIFGAFLIRYQRDEEKNAAEVATQED